MPRMPGRGGRRSRRLARDAPESAGLGLRRERAARTHQSCASAAGPLDREGAHACGRARPLDLAGDAPAGARLLRPAGGRLGRAGAARRPGALWLARQFPLAHVTGVDISEAMIERARAKLPAELSGRVDFLVGDAERLPFPDGSFDLVAQISVPVFFDEVARVLAPDGYAVVVSSLGPKTPFHTPARTLRNGFRRRGVDVVADGAAGPGTFFVGRLAPPRLPN